MFVLRLPCLILFALVSCSSTGDAPVPTKPIGVDPLTLDYNAFDQTPGQGWRSLAEGEDYVAAAELIDEYASIHDVSVGQLAILRFHAGQMYGFAGETDLAVERFRDAYREPDPGRVIRWNAYVDATIAFLERDATALRAARAEIAAGPVNSRGFISNLHVADAFLAHFDESYKFAYRNMRMPEAMRR